MSFPEWRLPNDDVVDEIAVEIAVSGTRRVRLTQAEMLIVARRLLASGGTAKTLERHVGMSYRNAKRIMAQIRKENSGSDHTGSERRLHSQARGSGRA